jgi:[histone H3]-lysine36 N-dimethyltransferase SETMAR
VTGDEKWMHHDNPKRKKVRCQPGQSLPSTSTSTPRRNIHRAKVMLSIWWDQLCVLYYELLNRGETVTGKRYREQLMQLSRAFKEKRPQYAKRHDKVIFQHDNAWPHVAKQVKETLETLGWDILPHPLVFSRHSSF